jgi:hypothetical protein
MVVGLAAPPSQHLRSWWLRCRGAIHPGGIACKPHGAVTALRRNGDGRRDTAEHADVRHGGICPHDQYRGHHLDGSVCDAGTAGDTSRFLPQHGMPMGRHHIRSPAVDRTMVVLLIEHSSAAIGWLEQADARTLSHEGELTRAWCAGIDTVTNADAGAAQIDSAGTSRQRDFMQCYRFPGACTACKIWLARRLFGSSPRGREVVYLRAGSRSDRLDPQPQDFLACLI